ncbi:hypothetical protein NJH49_04165 [Stenotrophomonas maltophilia]|uniref:tetratricopeptide repeat protein n=1 Tax=Stenotrophomonas maltophilia TaxID=40324 RepID=UPI002096C725|nr:tetratricopeptide repeat protein [Stenotrophomonas maltophilia]MCO7398933.1 hypothetical protein [Stenotrophomonas maltophilia]MCO7410581.1 hypothetical protein [Stenotrophomonas maltophilia]HDS1649358.1 hypothetical protein [Stenotrophomonas maltophilia]
MDIWNWVEKLQGDLRQAGQAQNAHLLNRLADDVSELQVDRVDALLPEARALGKALDNPWVDVYVGHWALRNRVGNRVEGESALGEAVALFERAHREDTLECPQSICVTQDLAACYGNIDGPGWVPERVEVCDETLARIDPSWACFQCLSCEKADALLDDGRGQEALDYLQAQADAIEACGKEVFDSFPEMQIKILLGLGRAEEALALIEKREAEVVASGEYEPANCTVPRRLSKAWALAQLGRDEEALQQMVPWSELTPNYWRLWANTAAALCRRDPARNTWDLGTRFNTIIEHFARVGSHRLLIEVAALSLELALQRGARWVAQRQLGLARAHLPQLRQDRGASALVAALAARVESLPEVTPLPVPATELLAWLEARGEQNHARDPEQEAQWLLQAHAQCPDDEPLADTAASALNACGAQAEARTLLWDFVAAHPQHDGAAAYTLMRWLAEQGDDAGLRRLADVFRDSVPVFAHWCEVQRARRVSDWPALELAAKALLELSPGSHGARGTLARMYMETGRFSDAQACYAELIELLEEPNAAHWDHMSAASAAHDWDAVRRSAAAIGMELSSTEGVVEEPWGWVIIRSEEEGEPMEYYARRSGPVTARIVENAPANHAQQVGDWVVFDAALVHPAPEDEEAREHFIPTYAQVHVLERGGFARSWLIDGAHPGEDAWNALVEAVEAQGWKIWAHSRPDYTVTDPEAEDGTLPGLLFTIAQPQDHAPLALHRFLQQATAGWAHPLCWLRLAEACDQDRQPHLDVIERYGL